jgi:hypothetical protein
MTQVRALKYSGPAKRKACPGQNLVELVLTLPFTLILTFFIIDSGRAWMAYESAKMAVRDAAYTASIFQNPEVGQKQLDLRILASGLKGSGTVSQVPNQHAYRASIEVEFTPLFGEMAIPTLSGPINLLPTTIPIKYENVTDVALY